MVITEDMDWISVLNHVCYTRMYYDLFLLKITGLQDDIVFPEPEELCARILEAHDVLNDQGWYLFLIIFLPDIIEENITPQVSYIYSGRMIQSCSRAAACFMVFS